MRTAEEILNGWDWGNKHEIIHAINEARKEAIEECAKRATTTTEFDVVTDIMSDYESDAMTIRITAGTKRQLKFVVNKQSILSLISEIK